MALQPLPQPMTTFIPCSQCNRPASPDAADGLCDACFDLRAEFEMRFVSAMRLHEEGRTGEALAALQSFLRDHAAEDRSRRFERQASEMAAHFLFDRDEDEAALSLFRYVAAIPGIAPNEAAGLGLAMARCLDRVGRTAEALEAIETALPAAEEPATRLALLAIEGELLGRGGRPVAAASIDWLARCIEELGIVLPAAIAVMDARSAARAVRVHEFYVEAAARYGVMNRTCEALIGEGRVAEAEERLSTYVATAEVAELGRLAAERLGEIRRRLLDQ